MGPWPAFAVKLLCSKPSARLQPRRLNRNLKLLVCSGSQLRVKNKFQEPLQILEEVHGFLCTKGPIAASLKKYNALLCTKGPTAASCHPPSMLPQRGR
eukprot:1152901-Pelagomonas_calceolata.AAC.11